MHAYEPMIVPGIFLGVLIILIAIGCLLGDYYYQKWLIEQRDPDSFLKQ